MKPTPFHPIRAIHRGRALGIQDNVESLIYLRARSLFPVGGPLAQNVTRVTPLGVLPRQEKPAILPKRVKVSPTSSAYPGQTLKNWATRVSLATASSVRPVFAAPHLAFASSFAVMTLIAATDCGVLLSLKLSVHSVYAMKVRPPQNVEPLAHPAEVAPNAVPATVIEVTVTEISGSSNKAVIGL